MNTCAVRFQRSRRLNGILIFIKHLTQLYILLQSFYFDDLHVCAQAQRLRLCLIVFEHATK